MNYSVRQYQPGDEEEIVSLLELVFDGWPHFDLECTPLEHWKWKYLDNPLKMNSTVVGISNDQIIGCDHSTYVNMNILKRTQICNWGADTAVHPDYRGIGVYSKIRKYKDEIRKNAPTPVNINFWSSGNPLLIQGSIRRNRPYFKNPIMEFIRIKDIDLHLSNRENKLWLKKIYLHLQKTRHAVSKIFTRSSYQADPKLTISEINSFDNRIKNFLEKIKDNYNFIIETDREFLNWRYCDPRGGKYTIKIAEKDDSILGYMVLRINKYNEQYHEGYIVDMLSIPDHPIVLESLLLDALSFFVEEDVNIIHSLAFRNCYYSHLLGKHGFISARNDQIIFFQPMLFEGDIETLIHSSPSKIHFTYGSSDWI